MPVVTGKPNLVFGARMQKLREGKGLSRELLAGRAEVSFSTVVRVEAGQLPRLEHLGRLAKVLGADVGDLARLACKRGG